jgi:hypothetical protein
LPAAAFNSFSHGARLAGPKDTFVSVNNDTVYSFAQHPPAAALPDRRRPRGAAAAGVRAPDPAVGDELAFYEQLRVWMQAFPSAAPERTDQQRFAPFGLLESHRSPCGLPAADLAEGLAAGRQGLEQIARNPNQPKLNGPPGAGHGRPRGAVGQPRL